MSSHGEVESKRGAVGRISEVESLAETVVETGAAGLRRRGNSQVECISGDTTTLIESGEFEVRLQTIVRKTNSELIAGELLSSGFELRTIGESPGKSGGNVRGCQIADWRGLIGELLAIPIGK